MNGANHQMNAVTTFPFYTLEGWEQVPLTQVVYGFSITTNYNFIVIKISERLHFQRFFIFIL